MVLFGAMCLSAAIGIVYQKCDFGFLVSALQNDSSFALKLNANQIIDLTTTPFAILHAFFALTWTAIFAVKFSFLIFFKKLITRVTKIQPYYWTVGAIVMVSWLFMVVEPLAVCRHPNASFGKMYPGPDRCQTC